MHFVGPDQLHGFEERLTTDIYPADFGWTPDYRKPGERIDWWYHNLGSVTGAGVAEITNQMEYDDEVAFQATQKLYELARQRQSAPALGADGRSPIRTTPTSRASKYWDLYENCDQLAARRVPPIPYDDHDPHSQRLFDANDWRSFDITEDTCAALAAAYFANISYLDDKIGEILATLEATHGRQHHRPVLLRPWRHAGRARHVVQDELLRRLGAGAADDFGSRRKRAAGRAHLQPRHHADAGCDLAGVSLEEVACPGPMAKAWLRPWRAARARRRC
jgi:hypothetical protein